MVKASFRVERMAAVRGVDLNLTTVGVGVFLSFSMGWGFICLMRRGR